MDSKHVGWDRWAESVGAAVTYNPADIRRYPRVVLRVDTRWLNDEHAWRKPDHPWSEALASIFWRGRTLTIFDEAMHTLPIRPHPDAERLFTQGAGLGLPVWVGSQAPLKISTIAASQSEHCFAFAMAHPGYRKELSNRRGIDCEALADMAGPDDPRAELRHEFAHHYLGAPSWTHFAPLTLVKERTTTTELNEPPSPPELGLVDLTEPADAGTVQPDTTSALAENPQRD